MYVADLLVAQVPEFRNFAPIPVLEHEIFDSVFDQLERDKARTRAVTEINDFRKTALSAVTIPSTDQLTLD